MSYLLGIDPGVSGAFVLLNERGALLQSSPLPVMGPAKHRRLDSPALYTALTGWTGGARELGDRVAFVEDLISMPGRSAIGAMQSGILFGSLLAVLQIHGFSIRCVRPRAWQKPIGGLPCAPSTKGMDPKTKKAAAHKHRRELKEVLRVKARLESPELARDMDRLGSRGDGLADAYWIARWGMSQPTVVGSEL